MQKTIRCGICRNHFQIVPLDLILLFPVYVLSCKSLHFLSFVDTGLLPCIFQLLDVLWVILVLEASVMVADLRVVLVVSTGILMFSYSERIISIMKLLLLMCMKATILNVKV